MKRMFEYQLRVGEPNHISLPENAVILPVQTRQDKPYLLVFADTDSERETRTFVLFNKTQIVGDHCRPVSTCVSGGRFYLLGEI